MPEWLAFVDSHGTLSIAFMDLVHWLWAEKHLLIVFVGGWVCARCWRRLLFWRKGK